MLVLLVDQHLTLYRHIPILEMKLKRDISGSESAKWKKYKSKQQREILKKLKMKLKKYNFRETKKYRARDSFRMYTDKHVQMLLFMCP